MAGFVGQHLQFALPGKRLVERFGEVGAARHQGCDLGPQGCGVAGAQQVGIKRNFQARKRGIEAFGGRVEVGHGPIE